MVKGIMWCWGQGRSTRLKRNPCLQVGLLALAGTVYNAEIAQNDDTWVCSLADSPGVLPPANFLGHKYDRLPDCSVFLSVPSCSWARCPSAACLPMTRTRYQIALTSDPFLQLGTLSTRLLRNTYRHPFLVLLNFVASLCAAIAIGLIFRDAGE
eukprot:1140006-Pelagomonas_calceolata.AAC.7